MTELTQPLAAAPTTETKPALRETAPSPRMRRRSPSSCTRTSTGGGRSADDHVPSSTKAGVPRRARALRGAPRRDRQRLLVLARRERGRADARRSARCPWATPGLRVPSRERLGDAELAGHRPRAAPLRRARRARADRAHRRPAAHLHAARDGLGRAPAEPRRRARRARRRGEEREAALEQEREALARDGGVLPRGRERPGADRLLRRHGGRRGRALGRARPSGSRSTGRPGRGARRGRARRASSASSSASTPASSQLDYDVGRPYALFLGGLRPLIGGAFALAISFAFTGGLLHLPVAAGESSNDRRLALLVVSFLAGFSERWAQDTLAAAVPQAAAKPES